MDDFNADNAKLDAALKAEEAARTAAVSAEEAARIAAISTVNNRITSEKATLEGAIAQRLHFVRGATLTQPISAGAAFTAPIPGLHLEEYYLAILTFTFPTVVGEWCMQINESADSRQGVGFFSAASGLVQVVSNTTQSVLLFPMKLADERPFGFAMGGGMTMCAMSTNAGKVSYLKFYPDSGGGTFNGALTVSVSGLK